MVVLFDAEALAYETVVLTFLGVWAAIASLGAFVLMALDKARARSRGRRVPERSLLGWAWLGGGPGFALALWLLRHKTRHGRFVFTAWAAGLLWAIPLVAFAAFLVWESTGH